MSTDFLNRRMDLIHEFKNGTHYLSMDTSYPVKLSGLVLKLFVATSNYVDADVNSDIAFSVKSAADDLVVNIRKENVFGFDNKSLKDNDFIKDDYVMVIIDLFNERLYICSQSAFANIIGSDESCEFKMFDITEETADRLAAAVAFQKDGISPKFSEYFSFTRSGNITSEDSHGDYTVYQLINKDNTSDELIEVPVADTCTKSSNNISLFIHPFAYLSFQQYVSEKLASVSLCYRLNIFKALYGYVGSTFISEFCFDYDYLKKYFLVDTNEENKTEYSLYFDGDSGKFTNYLKKDSSGNLDDSKNNEYVYTLDTIYTGGSFISYYGNVLNIRKNDGLFSVLFGEDYDLSYDGKSGHHVTIDCSGENSKFAGDRWGAGEKQGICNNTRTTYYYKNETEAKKYTLSGFVPVLKDNYIPNKKDKSYRYNITLDNYSDLNERNILLYDPYIIVNNKDRLNTSNFEDNSKSSIFNLFVIDRSSIQLKNNNFLENIYYLTIEDKTFDDFINNNKNKLFYHCLGKTPITEDITFNQTFKCHTIPNRYDPISKEFDNTVSYSLYNNETNNRLFINRDCTYLYTFMCVDLIKSYNTTSSILTTVPYKFELSTPIYDFNKRISLEKDIDDKVILSLKASSSNILKYDGIDGIFSLSNLSNDDSENAKYILKDTDGTTNLTLYSFLKFRLFGTNDETETLYGNTDKLTAINARSIDYKIDSDLYSNLCIRYLSSIFEPGFNQDLTNSMYIAKSKSNIRLFVNCHDESGKKYILSLAINKLNLNGGELPSTPNIENFSNELNAIRLGNSFCIDENGKLIIPNGIKLISDKYNISYESSSSTTTVYGIDVTMTFDFTGDKINLSFLSLYDNTRHDAGNILYVNYYNKLLVFYTENDNFQITIENNRPNVSKRTENYLDNDNLLLASTDDFFMITDTKNSIETIRFKVMAWEYNNSITNNTEGNLSETSGTEHIKLSDFFEDGTLASRNYAIPVICEKQGYYKYLKYIKSHNCTELFKLYNDDSIYNNSSASDQMHSNLIDKSMYMDSDGNYLSIYDFYKRCLQYNFNGELKTTFPNLKVNLISKSEIDKTITDCKVHDKIRPHHFIITKSSKDELDIKGKVLDSTFVNYMDGNAVINGDADNCYINSGTPVSNPETFKQYIYLSHNNNKFIYKLVDDDTAIEVTTDTHDSILKICNSYNLYNPENKKKFSLKNHQTYYIGECEVPVGNTYFIYTQCTIENDSNIRIYENVDAKNISGPDNIIFDSYFKYVLNEATAISTYFIMSCCGYDKNLLDNIIYTERCRYTSIINSSTKIETIGGVFENIKAVMTFSKIIPKSYHINLDSDDSNKVLKIDSNFTKNNVNKSSYVELPKKYQSTDINIYKSVTQTGLRETQSISLVDADNNQLPLNGIERKEVDNINWYDLLIALNNNQYIDVLGDELLKLKEKLKGNSTLLESLFNSIDNTADVLALKNQVKAILYDIIPDVDFTKVTGVGEVDIDGIPYLFAPDGALRTGFQTVKGKRYFYNYENGKLTTGWITIGDNTYYITFLDGKLTSQYKTIDGITYWFDEYGVSSEVDKKGPLYDINNLYNIIMAYHDFNPFNIIINSIYNAMNIALSGWSAKAAAGYDLKGYIPNSLIKTYEDMKKENYANIDSLASAIVSKNDNVNKMISTNYNLLNNYTDDKILYNNLNYLNETIKNDVLSVTTTSDKKQKFIDSLKDYIDRLIVIEHELKDITFSNTIEEDKAKVNLQFE